MREGQLLTRNEAYYELRKNRIRDERQSGKIPEVTWIQEKAMDEVKDLVGPCDTHPRTEYSQMRGGAQCWCQLGGGRDEDRTSTSHGVIGLRSGASIPRSRFGPLTS